MKPVSTATAFLLIAPAVVGAQQSTATTLAQVASVQALSEVYDDDRVVPGLGVSVDDLEDEDVYDGDGDEIGEVEEVLEDRSGRMSRSPSSSTTSSTTTTSGSRAWSGCGSTATI